MKTVKVGNRSFSMKRVRTFSPAGGFDQEKLMQKYPKAMAALTILTLAHQANPLKALLAIGSGKRQYDERTTEKFLADAEKFINSFESKKRTFSKGYIITEKDYQDYCDGKAGKIDSTRLLDIINDEGDYEDEMSQWVNDHPDESSHTYSGTESDGDLRKYARNEVNDASEKTIKEEIEKFLEDNYRGAGNCKISKKPINGKFIVDCSRDLEVRNINITSLTNGYFEFGIIDGYFNCSNCDSLKSLEGSPKEVRGNFDCRNCNSLTSLEGTPEEFRGNFVCSGCNSLTSLKGAPKKTVKSFNCSYCSSLTTLEGAPKEVSGRFDCSHCNSLTSLKGAPKKIGGTIDCSHCKSLTSLKGGPEEVGMCFNCIYCDSLKTLEGAPKEVGMFHCSWCNSLTSLKGAPKKVDEYFICSQCVSLTSLKGAPEKIGGHFDCSDCNSLKSLEGAPEKVGGYFSCYRCNSLTSLEGSPEKVNKYFDCYGCKSLTSLKGAPKEVGGDFKCYICKTKFTEEDVKNVSNVKGGIEV